MSQEEIDALFNTAKQSRKGAGARKRNVQPCDLRKLGTLNAEQVRVVTSLHEMLARRLGGSLGAYLRVGFDIGLVSVEQLVFSEFLARLPEMAYLASLRVMPIDARAAIQIDISLTYPMIDVVLGGSGSGTIDPRELTEIEEQILETAVRLIGQELQTTWAPVLDLEFRCEQRQRSIQMQSTMLLEERALYLRFDARLAEVTGTISLVFPAVISNVLLRKLSAKWSYSDRIPSRDSRRRVRERLNESRFMADLSLPSSPLSIRQFINLEPGQVLMLPKSSREPIHLNIAGKPMFLAYPVRQGARRSARIEKRISIASSIKK